MMSMTNAIALPTVQGDLDSIDLLLYTEASVPVIRNAALLRNIRPAQNPVHVDGIGGQLVIHTVEISMISELITITPTL